jgi:hypothetical protein
MSDDCAVPIPGAVESSCTEIFNTLKDKHATPEHPKKTLNLREEMFHIFISYRACEFDTSLVRELYSRIASQCRKAKRLPFMDKTVFPKSFKENDLSKQKLLNLFWDKETLADGKDWEGNGTRRGGGFIGAILQSLVFVPVLTKTGTLERMVDLPNKGRVDNVLLELTVAKFLCEYQSAVGQGEQGLSLWPCSLIFPIFGSDVTTECLTKCLSFCISRKTNEKAHEMLTRAGYTPDTKMLEDDSFANDENPHPWSVRSIVSFFFKMQGKKIVAGGQDRSSEKLQEKEILSIDLNECSERIFKVVENCIFSCKEMQVSRERINPLAAEMQNFLDDFFVGHFMHILNSNGIDSIRKVSQLDDHSMQLLSAQMATEFDSTEVKELCKLKDIVLKAQTRNESQALNQRLDNFFDKDASWSSALSSTCAVDLLMRKPFYLVVMIVGSAIFAIVGVYFLVFPTVYARSFPGSDGVQTMSNSLTSTAILCLVGAVGLGPICIGFSYLGSPKKGRYAAAYAFWLPLLIVQTAGYYADNANFTLCRYLSLETTESSVQECIIVYAIAFGIKELYFFACFAAVVFRQEYYYPFFTIGMVIVLSCNFFIYQYSQSTIFNLAVSAMVVILIFGLYITQRYSMRKTIRAATEQTQNDADTYDKAFKDYQSNAKRTGGLECLGVNWKQSNPGLIILPWEDSTFRKVVEQDCNDLERLYLLADLINLPFYKFIRTICSSKSSKSQASGLISSECNDFLRCPEYFQDPKVHLGPIKSTQRAIEKVQMNSKFLR